MRISVIKLLIVLIFFVLQVTIDTTYAQDSKSFNILINKYLKGIPLTPLSDYWLSEGLNDLKRRKTDDLTNIERRVIYTLIETKLNQSKSASDIQGDIYYLINNGITDNDGSNSHLAFNILNNTPIQYFNQISLNRLSNIIVSNDCAHLKEIIKLSGKLNITSLIPYYQSVINTSGKYSQDIIWASHLTLGKMGDIDQLKYCIESVKSAGMNDNVVFYLIPDLLYMQNRLVFNYIFEEILNSPLHCHSTDPDNPAPISCAYRLVEMVAPYIEEFPVETYESGDIITDDYEQMLIDVQNWIKNNSDSYQLKNLN